MVGFQLSITTALPGCMKLSFSFWTMPRVGAGKVIVSSFCAACGGTAVRLKNWCWLMIFHASSCVEACIEWPLPDKALPDHSNLACSN
jgi:hypothetical protein